MTNVRERVRLVVSDVLGIRQAELIDDRDISGENGQGGDSLDTVQIVMALEEEFQFEIPDDDAESDKMRSIDSITAYTEGRLAE